MTTGYTRLQIALHWLTVLAVPVQYLTYQSIERTHHAVHMGHQPEAADLVLHQIHILSGVTIGALMGLRLLLKLADRGARVPRSTLSERIAALVHNAFYAVLITQAATGFIASYLWFGTAALHKVLAWVIFALIAAHVGAAFWHVFRGDAVADRMLKARENSAQSDRA